MIQKYLLAVLVDNKPGVLTHVSGLISRRAFNIESISAGYTEDEDVTRINIVVSVASENELDQVVSQLGKLIDVIKIVNLSKVPAIERELVLIKVAATKRRVRESRRLSTSSVPTSSMCIQRISSSSLREQRARLTASVRCWKDTVSSRLPAQVPSLFPAARFLSSRCKVIYRLGLSSTFLLPYGEESILTKY